MLTANMQQWEQDEIIEALRTAQTDLDNAQERVNKYTTAMNCDHDISASGFRRDSEYVCHKCGFKW